MVEIGFRVGSLDEGGGGGLLRGTGEALFDGFEKPTNIYIKRQNKLNASAQKYITYYFSFAY